MKKRQKPQNLVGSDRVPYGAPMRYRVPQEASPIRFSLVLAMIILGLLLIGGAILGVLSLVDVIRGHSGETWHHFMAWFDSVKGWLLAGGIGIIALKFGFPLLEMRAHTALPRAEAAIKRAEARRIRKETQFLEDLHYHNLENLPSVFFHTPDANGNFALPIGPDGRPVAFLLPGNTATGNTGIPPKMVLDFLQQQNLVVEADEQEEQAPAQIEAPKKILLSQQIERGLTMPDEEESVFGYPIDTYEPFKVCLFEREGNFVNSLFVVGQQNQGKSTIGTYFAALTVNHRGYLLVIDPDAEISDQSLSSRLGPLKHFLLCEIADTPEKAKRLLELAENEIDHPSDFPLLLLVDEFSLIMRHGKAGGKWQEVAAMCASTVENYATRGRKRLRRAVVFGQISNASRTGGTELRDACAQIVFNTPYKKALLVLQDADDDEIAELAPSLTPGVAIVLQKSETYIMQFPFPDPRGLQIIAEVRAESDELVGWSRSWQEPGLELQEGWTQGTVDAAQPRLRIVPNAYRTSPDVDTERIEAGIQDELQAEHNPDLVAFQEGRAAIPDRVQDVPENGVREATEPSERVQDEFTPQPGDKLLNDLQTQLLITYYQDCKDVKLSLRRIKNDKGEGLGIGTYYRHACWILDSRGIRKRRA